MKKTELFKGKVFNITKNEYDVDGEPVIREIVNSDPVVHVICYDDGLNIHYVNEFRGGADKKMFGFVAGKIDEGETPEESAIREVEEEIGMKVIEINEMTSPLYTNVGISNEVSHFFIAKVEQIDESDRKHFQDEGENIDHLTKNIHDFGLMIDTMSRKKEYIGLKTLFLWLVFINVYTASVGKFRDE
jgi:ADP-ribose pyrophosphatase